MDNEYHYTGIDVKVKMIYDGKDNDIISQYVAFTKVYDEQIKLYGRTREAVTNTINICKDRDVLIFSRVVCFFYAFFIALLQSAKKRTQVHL